MEGYSEITWLEAMPTGVEMVRMKTASRKSLMLWDVYESWRDWFPETLKISIILLAALVGLLLSYQTFGGIALLIWLGACLLLS